MRAYTKVFKSHPKPQGPGGVGRAAATGRARHDPLTSPLPTAAKSTARAQSWPRRGGRAARQGRRRAGRQPRRAAPRPARRHRAGQ